MQKKSPLNKLSILTKEKAAGHFKRYLLQTKQYLNFSPLSRGFQSLLPLARGNYWPTLSESIVCLSTHLLRVWFQVDSLWTSFWRVERSPELQQMFLSCENWAFEPFAHSEAKYRNGTLHIKIIERILHSIPVWSRGKHTCVSTVFWMNSSLCHGLQLRIRACCASGTGFTIRSLNVKSANLYKVLSNWPRRNVLVPKTTFIVEEIWKKKVCLKPAIVHEKKKKKIFLIYSWQICGVVFFHTTEWLNHLKYLAHSGMYRTPTEM